MRHLDSPCPTPFPSAAARRLVAALACCALAAPGLGAQGAPVTLATPTGVLAGTLELPAGPGPFPVTLIIAGSGPTDRDGNSPVMGGKNNSLRLLAEALAARGVASVRYDKRGIAGSSAAGRSESDLRFDALVDDAAGWVGRLRGDARFSTVTVLGHSEGSLVGMLAARRAGADAFVSVAGVGRPAGAILREQLAPQLPPELMREATRVLEALETGRTVDSTPPALAALFRPSVQPYLVSWLRYDPAAELARLTVPVLVAQGTTDIQVPVSDARLLAAARPGAKLLVVEGMNHVLKLVPADRAAQLRSYGDSTLAVAAPLADSVAAFVRVTAAGW